MKYVNIILFPIKRNLIFFIFLYCLGILTSLLETWGLNFKVQRFNFFSWVMDVYLLCLLLQIVPHKLKTFFHFIILIIAYGLSIIDIFCVDTFSAKIGPEIVNVVLETNSQESSEFLDKYINCGILNSGLFFILVLLVLHIVSIINEVKIKSVFLSLLHDKYINRRVKLTINILFLFVVLVSFCICAQSRFRVVQLLFASDVKEVDMYISNFAENTPFNNLLFSLKMRQLESAGLNILYKTQESVVIDSCSYTSSQIVLIVGESYIKSHSQLYGYNLQTTPRQISRMSQSLKGCLVPFSDVVSPSNLTSVVFKNILSLHSIDEKEDWSFYPLFPVIFRRAGYNVTFITNQFVKELNTDIFNISGGLFINNTKISNIQFDYRNAKTHQYDIDILKDFDSLKVYNREHNLTIFHLAGQHIDFYKRCPPDMKRFNVTNYGERKDLDDSERQLVADYDNATYYNDYVLDSIINKFENEDAVIIYMPDHGEECYDELHRMGRLPVGHYSPEVLRQEYRIPFWIWCSHKYIENHPVIFEQILNACDNPFMTDDLPHLLLYLAGIKCKYFNERRCLISEQFNSERKRLIEGVADYDLIINH